MYKTLVVGTDGSPTADPASPGHGAARRSLNSALPIVTAFRTPRPGISAASGSPWSTAALARPSPRRAPDLWRAGRGGELDGLITERTEGQANPDDVILATAAEVEADLIVVISKGMPRRFWAACRFRSPTAPTAPCSWSRPTSGPGAPAPAAWHSLACAKTYFDGSITEHYDDEIARCSTRSSSAPRSTL